MAESVACSLMLMILLVGTFISFYASELMLPEKPFLRWTPEALLVLLTFVAIVALLKLSFRAEWGLNETNTSAQANRANACQQAHPKLIGLGIFYILLVALDITGISADSACIEPFMNACHSKHVNAEHALQLVCRLLRVLFGMASAGFCYKFRSRYLLASATTLAELAVVLSATIALWLYWLLDETTSGKGHSDVNLTLVLCNLTAIRVVNGTDEVGILSKTDIDCVYKTSAGYNSLESMSPFLYPCALEFLMLFAETLVGLFFGSLKPSRERRHEQVGPSSADRGWAYVGLRNTLAVIDEEPVDSSGDDTHQETEPRRANGIGGIQSPAESLFLSAHSSFEMPHPSCPAALHSNSCAAPEELNANVEPLPDGPALPEANAEPEEGQALVEISTGMNLRWTRLVVEYPWLATMLLIATAINVVFVVLGILATNKNDDDPHSREAFSNSFICYRIAYWLVSAGSAGFGYWLKKQFASSESSGSRIGSPTGFEYFVIITAAGSILYCTFSIVANIMTSDDVCPTPLCLVEALSNIVQIMAQTVFYFTAKTAMLARDAEPRDGARRMLTCFPPGGYQKCFRTLILAFAFSNLALWVEDSFIEVRSIENAFQVKAYTLPVWSYIYYTVNPLALMYRFNSMILFLDISLGNSD